ncbi:hypothetical protein PPHE_a1688 [Pseudoalteromonas phenolica O-BC30]|nr:hypothetical protein [Pseudoalteromonas phenolica O-BC30]
MSSYRFDTIARNNHKAIRCYGFVDSVPVATSAMQLKTMVLVHSGQYDPNGKGWVVIFY